MYPSCDFDTSMFVKDASVIRTSPTVVRFSGTKFSPWYLEVFRKLIGFEDDLNSAGVVCLAPGVTS